MPPPLHHVSDCVRPTAPLDGTAERFEHWLPLVGGVMLGMASLPGGAAGAEAPDTLPPPLKLAREFASLGAPSRPSSIEQRAQLGETESPQAAPLQLSLALTPRVAPRVAETGPDNHQPEANASTLRAPSPSEPTTAQPPKEVLPPSRRSPAPAAPPQTSASPVAMADTANDASSTPTGISATVVGSDEFLPADDLDVDLPAIPPRAPGSGAALAPGALGQDRPSRRWGVAPIRWGGELSVGWSQSRPDNGAPSSAQIYQGRLRANSYLMQPYIALVSTDFMLTTSRTQSGGDSAANNLTGTSISGTGNLNVFPQSRFPFSAALSLSDSRSDGSLSSSNISRKQLSLRQQYRPPVGAWHTSVNYDRSQLEGDFGTDVVDRILGDYSTQIAEHSLGLNAEVSRNATNDSLSQTFYAGGNHSAQISDTLFWSNSGTILEQNVRTDVGAESVNVRLRSAQLFTFLNWIPQDSRLRGNGSLRYFQTRSDLDGNVFERQTLGGNGGLNFQVNRNLNLGAGAGFNLDKDGNSSTSQSLSAGYSGDPLSFGNYSYNWYSSLSAANAQSSEGENSRSVSASVGHGVARSWTLAESTQLNANLNQTAGTSRSMGAGTVSSTTLSHSASLSVSANAGERLNGFFSASLSDNRSMGETESTFQMLNMQLSGNWRINRLSDLQSNLTWQLSRQESAGSEETMITDEFGNILIIDTGSESTSSSLGGSISYGHRQFAGVRGLRYQADFRANTGMTRAARRFGDPNADRPEDQVTMQLDQRLLYSIGRLHTELVYSITETQGTRNQRILLRATRSFGAF